MLENIEHSNLSASKSARWLACPGSLIEDNPNAIQKTSDVAIEGTVCHQVAEDSLYFGDDASIFLGDKIDGVEVTHEMVNHVNSYIDYYRSFYSKGCIGGFEKRVDYSKFAASGFGTCDAFIINPTAKICHVFDLKYGRNPVDVEANTQLQLYALGLTQEYDLTGYRFILHIVQPRIYSFDSWETTYEAIMSFGAWVHERATIALSDNAPRVAGEKQCEYCPNNPTCKVLAAQMEKLTNEMFDKLGNNNPNMVDNEFLEKMYSNRKLILDYLDKCEEVLLEKMLKGDKFKNLKLVESRKHRVLTNEAESVLVKYLGDRAFQPRKLIAVGEAEALLKPIDAKLINKITFKPKGMPSIAPLSDRRKPIIMTPVNDEFEDLGDIHDTLEFAETPDPIGDL